MILHNTSIQKQYQQYLIKLSYDSNLGANSKQLFIVDKEKTNQWI